LIAGFAAFSGADPEMRLAVDFVFRRRAATLLRLRSLATQVEGGV
jgi:hypothetical protein